jgi:hypothetical protein
MLKMLKDEDIGRTIFGAVETSINVRPSAERSIVTIPFR